MDGRGMSYSTFHTILGPNAQFLTHATVPLNLLRLKPGDHLVVQTPRVVERVGYRRLPSDYREIARELCRNDPELYRAMEKIRRVSGGKEGRFNSRLLDALAYGLAVRDQFGGPDRGILVSDRSALLGYGVVVESTRCVQVGVRFAPRFYEDDAEPGGLSPRATVVLVRCAVSSYEFLSGDLARVPAEPTE